MMTSEYSRRIALEYRQHERQVRFEKYKRYIQGALQLINELIWLIGAYSIMSVIVHNILTH